MKITLYGVETHNKGAELMLYAILQEIERKYPDATVYIPYSRCKQGLDYIQTSLKLKYTPFSWIIDKLYIPRILKKLKMPQAFLARFDSKKGADMFLDGSGFAISDQWNPKVDQVNKWEKLLKPLHKSGGKIVFLPQAFGPFKQNNSQRQLAILGKYADVIMPREKVSLDYVRKTGLVPDEKIKMFADFTSLVEGVFPSKYDHLRNGICIIPNHNMVDCRRGKISYDDYMNLMLSIIKVGKNSGHPVYMLNHEGAGDATLCKKCSESMEGEIEAVTDLNSLEVKGLISSAYIVITSRFHGLASALNSCVPSLATSWSHKYEELYKDYDLEGYLLPLDNLSAAICRVEELLKPDENAHIRNHLEKQLPRIMAQSREMWDYVWTLKK